ncbi:unnamed protein product [Sphenostylis stenocarpa]|uniref:Uncharacterized protein n=1 Tax=Sphenostylis stenocarpa TaxID=92480 RepID=A0AA86SNZ5_9FABA|nr:unnamed protein product [Sphenostylis stenocarpa]
MSHCVPDFEIQMDDDEEFPIPVSKKPSMQNDNIMELLWQNGQVVMHSQNHRPLRRPPPPLMSGSDGVNLAKEIRPPEAGNYSNQHLFMQEDEMASWLHYPIHEDPTPFDHHHGFCADMLYPPPNATASQSNNNAAMQSSLRGTELRHPPPRPPIPPRKTVPAGYRMQNFAHFSKHGNASSSSKATAAQPTVVDSCETPVAEHAETGRASVAAAACKAAESDGRETTTATCDVTVTSSPGGSSRSASAEPVQREPDRKRKGREPEESEFQSEVSELTRFVFFFLNSHTFHMLSLDYRAPGK